MKLTRGQLASRRRTFQKFYAKRLSFFRGMAPIWKAALFPEAAGSNAECVRRKVRR